MAIIVSNWMDDTNQVYLGILKIVSTLSFFTYVLVLSLTKLFATKSNSLNSIIGVINGFIIHGIIAGTFLLVINLIWPDAFVFSYSEPYTFLSFVYFGFVTITTLGFGDIITVTPPGQPGIKVFSVLGQMYLATIIASFVGEYSTLNQNRKE